MSVAWSWAFDTPFKWTKQIASHFGGTRQGMVISWPGHIKDVGGIRSQFHHMIDIVPTILEATGIQAPAMVNGIAQKPIVGVSMVYTFDQANANAPSKRDTQYFEMFANRGIYHDGWYAATTPPVPPWLLGTAKLPGRAASEVAMCLAMRSSPASTRLCSTSSMTAPARARVAPVCWRSMASSWPKRRSRTRFRSLWPSTKPLISEVTPAPRYKLPFRFTGKIDKLTYKLGATQMSGDERRLMQHALERAKD
jgi:hypothetical protein